ncbi:hypothetical protein M422DRAFT_239428 [Sphaerobolus stellatus SS14]|nr:hypothetical protein M422DRAFT_239428 [Sphaerobolus stellatus SS14]
MSSRFKEGLLKIKYKAGNLLRSRPPSSTPSGNSPSSAPSQASHSNLISEPSAPSPHPFHMKLAWECTKEVLRATCRVSDVFPPLKSAVAGFLEVIDRVEAVRDIPNQLGELEERIKQLNQILNKYNAGMSGTLKDRIEGLARVFEDKKSNIGKKLERSLGRRVVENTADSQYIAEELRSLSFAIEICMMDVNMDTHKLVTKLQHIAILNSLGEISGAEFNREDRQACMDGTRISLLGDLLAWATDANSHRVCWLNGLAGTGKTTVTESFCRILAQKEMLGASFFCSRGNEARRNVRNIIPFLAKILARMLPSYQQKLITVLDTYHDPQGLNLQDQYQHLIVEPLNAIHISKERSEPLVLSVDALDECEDKDGTEELLRVILEASLHFPLKFFLTGRPESALRQGFQVDNFGHNHKHYQLHDIEHHLVEADIRMYLTRQLEILKNKQWKDIDWPADDVNALIKRSGRLFIFAATTIKFLRDTKGNPTNRLRKLAMLNTDSIEATRSIDSLYELVLSEAFRVDDDEQLRVKDSLVTAVCAHTPLPVSSYSVLLGMGLEDVHAALAALHSVVHISNHADPIISVYHASFPNYLTSSKRSGNQLWYFALEEGHLTLATKCLELMNMQLDFNIVKLTTSHFSNDEQPSAPLVAPPLAYACTGWGDHLFHSTNVITKVHTLLGRIVTFLQTKFLYWLEVLSVLKNVQYASTLLLTIDKRSETLQTICKDFIEFISNFRGAIEYNAAHIYLSALAFVHPASMVAELYHSHFPNLLAIHGRNVMVTRQHELLLFRGHTSSVQSVTFSPDGKHIVAGSSDSTICLWSVETGKAVGEPYKGHTSSVMSVAFSPHGKHIVSGSHDNTIRLWSVETGKAVGEPYEGHTDSVLSVAFSPDGKHIVSGSYDKTIRLWSVETGKAVGEPYEGHTYSVWSVAFSPDGKHIVSGSDDKTIRLWSVETGKAVGEPYEGHTDSVQSVAFSPDGKHIVSGSSDNTIHLWSVETGKAVGEPYKGHTSSVSSVAFSPDGKHIVSGPNDNTIHLWSVETGKAAGESHQGHIDIVKMPQAKSPFFHYLSSGSFTFIHWDQNYDSSHGWVTHPLDTSVYLFWVPPRYRSLLCTPGTAMIFHPGSIQLDLSNFTHGDQWARCKL